MPANNNSNNQLESLLRQENSALKKVLSDPEAAKKLLSTPQAQKLFQLFQNKQGE